MCGSVVCSVNMRQGRLMFTLSLEASVLFILFWITLLSPTILSWNLVSNSPRLELLLSLQTYLLIAVAAGRVMN